MMVIGGELELRLSDLYRNLGRIFLPDHSLARVIIAGSHLLHVRRILTSIRQVVSTPNFGLDPTYNSKHLIPSIFRIPPYYNIYDRPLVKASELVFQMMKQAKLLYMLGN